MCLFNIRSWNDDSEHIFSDKICATYSSLFCFTETSISDSLAELLDEILNDQKDNIRIRNMSWLYVTTQVNIEVVDIPSVLEVLSVVLEIEKETFLLVVVQYHVPGPFASFIDYFILLISELGRQHRILNAGGFNHDQMFPEHVAKVDPLI